MLMFCSDGSTCTVLVSSDQRPSVLWCLYFNMADGSTLQVEGHSLPSNVYICCGPDGDLGHEHAVKQAESIFQKILPEEEFCPPAPNPEDIIYDGENTSTGEDRGAVDKKDLQEEENNGKSQEENQEQQSVEPEE
ncbi:hypothetical protein ILYODFUR_038312 [Ilyodon furcidens]|uniref:RAE1/2 domain-containing protein n=1 Tax=Ilyodon furcidens TaxID=33524 RepID=A0ABV0UEK1_9TELE